MSVYSQICSSVSCGSEDLAALLNANKHLVLCDGPSCRSTREAVLRGMMNALRFAMAYAANKIDVSESSGESESQSRGYSEDHSRDYAYGEGSTSACTHSYSDSANQTLSSNNAMSRDFSDDNTDRFDETYTFNYDRAQAVSSGYNTAYSRAADRSFSSGASYAANIDTVDVESWMTKDACPETDNCDLPVAAGPYETLGAVDLGFPEFPGITGVGGWLVDVVFWVVNTAFGMTSLAFNHIESNAPGVIFNDPAWNFYTHICPNVAQGTAFNDGICPSAPEETLCNGEQKVIVTFDRDLALSVFNWQWRYRIEREWKQQHTITHNCDESTRRSHSDAVGVGDSHSRGDNAELAITEGNGDSFGHQDIVRNADETNYAYTQIASSGSSIEWGYARSMAHSEGESQSQSADTSWSRSQSENWSQTTSSSESRSASISWSNIMRALKNLWETVESELSLLEGKTSKNRGSIYRGKLTCKKAVARDRSETSRGVAPGEWEGSEC